MYPPLASVHSDAMTNLRILVASVKGVRQHLRLNEKNKHCQMRHSESTCGTVCVHSGCNPKRNLAHASPSTVSNLARIKRATGREISAVSTRPGREVPVVANTLGWQSAGSQRSQFRVGGTLRNPGAPGTPGDFLDLRARCPWQ